MPALETHVDTTSVLFYRGSLTFRLRPLAPDRARFWKWSRPGSNPGNDRDPPCRSHSSLWCELEVNHTSPIPPHSQRCSDHHSFLTETLSHQFRWYLRGGHRQYTSGYPPNLSEMNFPRKRKLAIYTVVYMLYYITKVVSAGKQGFCRWAQPAALPLVS